MTEFETSSASAGSRDYSLASFEAAKDDPERLSALRRALCEDITARLQPTLVRLMEEIVDELNGQGHDLRLVVEPAHGEIVYRDSGPQDRPVARLRVAHDSVVSVGFGDFDPA